MKDKINNPEINNNQKELLSAFSGGDKNQTVEILKELLQQNNINMITDLTPDQIKLCTRIHIIAKIKNMPIWDDVLKYYMSLLLSKNRQSRKEILEAIKGSVNEQQNMFSRAINGMRR